MNITTCFIPFTFRHTFYKSYLLLYSRGNSVANIDRGNMRKLAVICFSLIFVASCASNGSVSQWHGETLGTLIGEYGTPDSFLKLEDGHKVVEYDKNVSTHLAGSFCSLTFIVDHRNLIAGASKQGNGSNCMAKQP